MTILPLEGKEAHRSCSPTARARSVAVFMGRRGIGGLSLGKRVVVEGVLGEQRGDVRMVNPRLEFAS